MLVTLDLPEPLAAQLLSMPEPERSRYATEIFDLSDEEITFTADPPDFTPVNPNELPPGDKAALLRGIAGAQAGSVTPFADAMAEIAADLRKMSIMEESGQPVLVGNK